MLRPAWSKAKEDPSSETGTLPHPPLLQHPGRRCLSAVGVPAPLCLGHALLFRVFESRATRNMAEYLLSPDSKEIILQHLKLI